MAPVMQKAPLVHVVAEISFSHLPDPSKEVIEKLHGDLLEADFPEHIESIRQAVEFVLPALGSTDQAQQTVSQIKRQVFRNAHKTKLVEFTQDPQISTGRIIYKVTDYAGKEAFFAQLQKLLEIFKKHLPNLSKTTFKGVSLNYVDLIVPEVDQQLSDLVTAEICPPQLTTINNQKFMFGTSFRMVETAPGQRLQVAFEEVRPNEEKLTKVLPDHLMEADPRCGLNMQAREHWWQIKSETYGILSVQHLFQPQESQQMQAFDSIKKLRDLQEICSQVFKEVTTETAIQTWS